MTPALTKLLEDLRSGAVRLVPGEATHDMQNAMAFYHINHAGPAGDAEMSLARSSYKAMLSRAPDLTPALVEMIEGLVRERDEAMAERDALREVLAPFGAVLKGNWSKQSDEAPIVAGMNEHDLRFKLTLGDFRRACTLTMEKNDG